MVTIMNERDSRGHIDFSEFESGFYPVLTEDGWDIQYWDEVSFMDCSEGQYSPHDPSEVLDIGELIELPNAEQGQ